MGNDEVQVLVALAVLLGIAAGDGALVQGVPDALALEHGQTADAGIIVQFVGHDGIGDVAGATQALGNLIGDDTTQVACVLVFAGIGGLNHVLINGINTTGQGLGQAAAGDNGIKFYRDSSILQLVQNHFTAEVKLVSNLGKWGQLLGCMADNFNQAGLAVLNDSHLSGGRSGIDN